MITTVEMYAAECNTCKDDFEGYEGFSAYHDEDRLYESMVNGGWHVEDKNCYCPKCHYIDDEDYVVLRAPKS